MEIVCNVTEKKYETEEMESTDFFGKPIYIIGKPYPSPYEGFTGYIADGIDEKGFLYTLEWNEYDKLNSGLLCPDYIIPM